ncbi:MAG: glycosyltransferase family 4 protein [Armatimonadota bacterium]
MPKRILHTEVAAVHAGSTMVLLNHLKLCSDKWEHSILFRHAGPRKDFGDQLLPEMLQRVKLMEELEEEVLGRKESGMSKIGKPLLDAKHEDSPKSSGRLRTLAGLAKYYITTVLPEAKHKAEWLKAHPFDLVQLSNGPLGNTQGVIAAGIAGYPLTARLQSFMQVNPLEKLFLKRPLGYIAVADSIKYHYVAQGIPESRILTVHEGLTEDEFEKPQDYSSVKSELGVSDDQPLVGLVGRLVWWKGHDYFIEACADVSANHPNARFVIVGGPDPTEPDYENHLRRKAIELGLGDRMIFAGFKSPVKRYTAALDVAVLASCLPEPGGRSILEAMAMGIPSISTDAGGMPEYVGRDGTTGLLVPIQDSCAMAQAIDGLLSDRGAAEEMGRLAKDRMYSQFHMRQTVAGIEQFWEEMLLRFSRNGR